MTKQDFQCVVAALTLFRSLPNEYSVSYLIDTIDQVSNYIFGNEPKAKQQQTPQQAPQADYLDRPIDELIDEIDRINNEKAEKIVAEHPDWHTLKHGIAKRIRTITLTEEIQTVGELLAIGSKKFRNYRNIGVTAIDYISDALLNLYGIERW